LHIYSGSNIEKAFAPGSTLGLRKRKGAVHLFQKMLKRGFKELRDEIPEVQYIHKFLGTIASNFNKSAIKKLFNTDIHNTTGKRFWVISDCLSSLQCNFSQIMDAFSESTKFAQQQAYIQFIKNQKKCMQAVVMLMVICEVKNYMIIFIFLKIY